MIGRMQTVLCALCARLGFVPPDRPVPAGWKLVGDGSDCWCARCVGEADEAEIADDPRAFIP